MYLMPWSSTCKNGDDGRICATFCHNLIISKIIDLFWKASYHFFFKGFEVTAVSLLEGTQFLRLL